MNTELLLNYHGYEHFLLPHSRCTAKLAQSGEASGTAYYFPGRPLTGIRGTIMGPHIDSEQQAVAKRALLLKNKEGKERRMLTKDNMIDLIYDGLRELNAWRAAEHEILLRPDTKLLDKEGLLGSLEVVELIVMLETELTQRLNRNIRLLDEQLLSQQNPLRDIASLAAFLEDTLAREEN